MTNTDFSSLNIKAELLSSIQALDYKLMTPIQAQSLPNLLMGKDLIAQAKTGSGKTAAFAIGLLNKLDALQYNTQALVICPTRELADQVSNEIRRLARDIANTKVLTLCGGKPMGPQLASLQRDPHIVVGTPGRLLKHLDKGTLQLGRVNTLVLDEADRMLDMGFHEDIMQIIDYTPRARQTLLFSATYPSTIEEISAAVQTEPVNVRVESSHHISEIKQSFYEVAKGQRTNTFIKLLKHFTPESSLVFCNTKQQCQQLADELRQQDIHALSLHGDLEQFQRDQVLVQFSNKSSSVLIATDVAARGLDIKDLEAVINFELSRDPEVHVHRIGRTGRAGKKGLALSLFMASEHKRLKAIEEYQDSTAAIEDPSILESPEIFKLYPPMVTLFINGGRKDKVRAGDLLGALTSGDELSGDGIGKIDIFDKIAYVAVEQKLAKKALQILSDGKIKGRKFRVRRLR